MLDASTTDQIVDVLTVNLASVFANLCTQRYGGPISLERVEEGEETTSSTVTFRLDREDLPPTWAHFAVRHVGGNVYDVRGTIENGPSQSFTYSLPESSPPHIPQAPTLAREVAAFLLDAMESRLGTDLLRGNIRPSRTPERTPPPPASRTPAS